MFSSRGSVSSSSMWLVELRLCMTSAALVWCVCLCLVPLLSHHHRQSKMAGPLFLQNLLAYSTSVVAVAFIGHLDDPSLLSSAVLANSLFNVSGYSVVQGLSAGMETLCGQVSCCLICCRLLATQLHDGLSSFSSRQLAAAFSSCSWLQSCKSRTCSKLW
jgi:hypothetical protein